MVVRSACVLEALVEKSAIIKLLRQSHQLQALCCHHAILAPSFSRPLQVLPSMAVPRAWMSNFMLPSHHAHLLSLCMHYRGASTLKLEETRRARARSCTRHQQHPRFDAGSLTVTERNSRTADSCQTVWLWATTVRCWGSIAAPAQPSPAICKRCNALPSHMNAGRNDGWAMLLSLRAVISSQSSAYHFSLCHSLVCIEVAIMPHGHHAAAFVSTA